MAAVVVGLFAAASCLPLLARTSNLVWLLTALLAGALVIGAGVSSDRRWILTLGEFGAGVSAALWLQPSVSGLIAVAVATVAAASLRRANDLTFLGLGTTALIVGIVIGRVLQFALAGGVSC